MSTADEAIAHNLADVFENGPRLSWNRKTAALAIDRAHGRVLLTGLGSLGVGTMWCDYIEESAEWAVLPDRDSTGEFGAGPLSFPIAPPALHGAGADALRDPPASSADVGPPSG